MRKLFFGMLLSLTSLFTGSLFAQQQQYDMSYQTFKDYIEQEMTEDEYRSITGYFEEGVDGLVCFYDFGDFSGDTLDEFVMLTHENSFEHGQKISIYIFHGTEKGFEFVDKVTHQYWKSRYEVATLIKNGVLFVTSTDRDYVNWTWTLYKVDKDSSLKLLREETYQ